MRSVLVPRRTRTSTAIVLSALAMFALTGCPGADEAGGAAEDGAKGGADLGDGGEAGTRGEGAAGAAGDAEASSDPDAGGGGASATGTAGTSGAGAAPPNGGGGTSPGFQVPFPCVGAYETDAIWPAAGRCSARQGSTDQAGPQNFAMLRSVTLGAPLTTSPVIAANGDVWITNEKGLWRVDADLTEVPAAPVDPNPSASAPVVQKDGSVLTLTTSGLLRRCTATGPCATIVFERAPADTKAVGWASDLAIDDGGDVWFTSPSSRLYRVTPTPNAASTVSFGVSAPQTENQVELRATSAVTISPTGSCFFGTSLGLAALANPNAKGAAIVLLSSARVSHPPVFVEGRGAVYADDAGVVHTVRFDEAGAPQTETGNDQLDGAPGAFAVLGGPAPMVFLGVGTKLQVLSTTDESANVDNLLDYALATGPILAPAATDAARRLFVPSTDGNLYFVRAAAGGGNDFETVDSYLTSGSLQAGAALGSGRIYFGSADESLYLIVDDTVTLDAGDPAPGGDPTP
jgi:hypothetical protein